MTDTDPHLAAYAKGLEDALSQLLPMIPVAAENDARRVIAALLPPGTRVVVVPPKGSEEWERALERGMDYSRRAVSCGFASEQHLELRLTYAVAAALRALTGGDDRG